MSRLAHGVSRQHSQPKIRTPAKCTPPLRSGCHTWRSASQRRAAPCRNLTGMRHQY